MNRADLARVAVRAYPRGARQTSDSEIISTLLDAGDTSSAAFLRELTSVIGVGLAQRAAHAQRFRPSRLIVEALIYGGLVLSAWMAENSSYVAAPTLGAHLWVTGLVVTVLVAGLGWWRAAGVIGIASLAALRLAGSFSQIDDIWAACQLASFFAMVALSPNRQSTRGRITGLTLAAAALLVADLYGTLPIAWYLMAAVGVVAVPLKPALTLGIGGLLAAIGAMQTLYLPLSTSNTLLILAAPIALALIVARQRAASRTDTPLS